MIGKIIQMHRPRTKGSGTTRLSPILHLRDSVFALTRYIVDADPRALVERKHNILSLTDYALAMKDAGVEPGEKVEAFGARNLVGDDLRGWQAQMLAVAARAPKVTAPLTHIILSLHESEHWAEHQRDEAITIVLETLGLERCQAIWAEHSDTPNPHIHLSVIRVDPASGKAAGSDWLIDDLHQALALIEERQGRIREPNALYVARGGIVYDAQTGLIVRDVSGRYAAGGKKTSRPSRERLPETSQPLRPALFAAAREASSWAELHAGFRELGAAYDKAGSGARISVGQESHKASEWHRSFARSELEKRLGPFAPDAARTDPGHEAYDQAVTALLTALRAQREADSERLDRWLKASLAAQVSARSKRIEHAMRAEARAARAALRRAYAEAIRASAQQKMTREKWNKAGRPAAPSLVTAPALILPADGNGQERQWSLPSNMIPRHIEYATEYRNLDGKLQFTDHRLLIIVHAARNVEAVDAALRLGAKRWGRLKLDGPAAFVALAAERAQALGIEFVAANYPAAQPMRAAAVPVDRSAENARHSREPAPASPPAKTAAAAGPTRAQEIEAAVHFLAASSALPLRRRKEAGDTELTGYRGMLEIDLAALPTNAYGARLAHVARLNGAPAIQACLEQLRRQQIKHLGEHLRRDPEDRSTEGTETSGQRLTLSDQGAAHSARHDHDWLALLAEVHREQAAREKARMARINQQREASPAPEQQPAKPESNAAKLHALWRQSQGLGR